MGTPCLFTTLAGAHRLGAPAEGLAPWQSTTIGKEEGANAAAIDAGTKHDLNTNAVKWDIAEGFR